MDILISQFGAEAAGEKASGAAVLGINLPALLLQLITFVILFLLLRKYAFKTIVSKLDERQKTINDGVTLGQHMKVQQEQLDAQTAKILHHAREEADKIIAASHHEATNVIKQAEATTARKTDAMLVDARNRIETETASARKGLEAEVGILVAAVAEKIIGEKLDASKDAELIRKSLKEAKR